MIIPVIMRGVVIVMLTVISTVHYQSSEWLLLAGDVFVGSLVGFVWAYPFIIAQRQSKRR